MQESSMVCECLLLYSHRCSISILEKMLDFFGHLLKTICSKNLNSYNILSHIYCNVHYFLAIHLAILVLQNYSYSLLEVSLGILGFRLELGQVLAQVLQTRQVSQTRLSCRCPYSVLTTPIMLTRSIFNPYIYSLRPQKYWIFPRCLGYSRFIGYSKIPQNISRFHRIFQKDIPRF